MKPLIGLTSYYVEANELGKNRPRGSYDQDLIIATADYAKSIEAAGGMPMILPCSQDKATIRAYVSKIDGLLLAGGEDLYPGYYQQTIQKGLGKVSPLRDAFEWALLEEALAQDKPVLGICRGHQLINVFYGGSLFQDMKQMDFTRTEHMCLMVPKYVPCHDAEVYVNTHLYKMLDVAKIQVNSKHHQSIDALGEGLIVSSKAMDGVIEGIEDPNKSFVVGVQWHPEMMVGKEPLQAKIFDGFIRQCKK